MSIKSAIDFAKKDYQKKGSKEQQEILESVFDLVTRNLRSQPEEINEILTDGSLGLLFYVFSSHTRIKSLFNAFKGGIITNLKMGVNYADKAPIYLKMLPFFEDKCSSFRKLLDSEEFLDALMLMLIALSKFLKETRAKKGGAGNETWKSYEKFPQFEVLIKDSRVNENLKDLGWV